MARKKKPNLPTAGTAFPLADGRYSVCRVLLDATSKQSKEWKTNPILVAGSTWIGDQVPNPADPALRPILYLNHHTWRNEPNVAWVSDEPPQEFIRIGTITPTAKERAFPCASFGTWATITIQPLAQWRWDNDRDAVLAEDAADKKKLAEHWSKLRQDRDQYLGRVTLDELRKRRFFRHWKDYPPAKYTRAARKILTDTVEQLLALGPRASKGQRMSIL